MNTGEAIFFWATALFMAVSFFMGLLSAVFKKPKAFNIGRLLYLAGFIAITAFGIIRWARTGHPPFVTLFESMITAIWFVALIYHLFRLKFDCISILFLPISFVSFLMIGWASSLSHDATPLSAALSNVWLFIHASFATSGAAAFLIAASLAALYLMGEKKINSMEVVAKKVPIYNNLPKGVQNFMIFGLILWGVMIVSGSIWAHIAWGRYWAWDPIELWSLISWILYGLILHAHLAFGLTKRVFCWAAIIAAVTIVFSLWGVQYIYNTIHTYG
ncbi:MAG: cytochrome c biogenesis protein CcsA [Candidatus Zixiibacteriota bacterium]|nr:MAG: cytochrome c biogenesis protein CcsA [candidate division Zixibacteria bacterium]